MREHTFVHQDTPATQAREAQKDQLRRDMLNRQVLDEDTRAFLHAKNDELRTKGVNVEKPLVQLPFANIDELLTK